MKTYIKKPDNVEIFKMEEIPALAKGVFDDMENGICGLIDGLKEQMGCDGMPSGFVSALCSIANSVGASLGCDELNLAECNLDTDCMPFQECVDGICTTPEGVCFNSEDCETNEVCQDMGCCLPQGKVCEETAECCAGLNCLGGIITGADNQPIDKNIVITKYCTPQIII